MKATITVTQFSPTEIIEQKFFTDGKGGIRCIDVMPVNRDTWQTGVEDGWQAVSPEEVQAMLNPPLTAEEMATQMEEKRQRLLAEAKSETEMLRTKLLLGRISQDEERQLHVWFDYIEALEAADVSVLPEDEWPVKPG